MCAKYFLPKNISLNCVPGCASKSGVDHQETNPGDHGGDGKVGVPFLLERSEHSICRVGRLVAHVGHVAKLVHPVIRHGDEKVPWQQASHTKQTKDQPSEAVSITGRHCLPTHCPRAHCRFKSFSIVTQQTALLMGLFTRYVRGSWNGSDIPRV